MGTMPLTGRGNSPTDTLTLRALQAGVASAVDKSGMTPPVIVAHSMAVSLVVVGILSEYCWNTECCEITTLLLLLLLITVRGR